MLNGWQTGLSFFRARLSRKITLWVFLSIVVVELVILLPSAYRRQQEILQQLEQVSKATISPLLRLCGAEINQARIRTYAHKLMVNSPVKGGAVYLINGRFIGTFGEIPDLTISQVMQNQLEPSFSSDQNRYNVILRTRENNLDYLVIIRVDSSSVKFQVKGFIIRILGLVLIICIFVTLVTILLLGPVVILPILKLRQALLAVGQATGEERLNLSQYQIAVNRQDELGEVMEAFNSMICQISSNVAEIKNNEKELKVLVKELEKARDQADELLLNILPKPIADQLKQGVYPIAESFPQVTVLFADIVGFTELSQRISPVKLVELLNDLFSRFDRLVEKHCLEKIKTIGDAYMVVGGLPMPRSDHAEAIAEMALDMQQEMSQFCTELGEPINIRIGINSGPVVAGVLGIKKFVYDLWGDTVNIASRMESHGLVGSIQVSEVTYQLLGEKYSFVSRGEIEVKGKGKTPTYLLVAKQWLSEG